MTEAEFYCEDCSKVYCGKCLEYHNFLYQKHATLDKKNISKWPVTNSTFDVLEQCQVHKDRKLEIFCEDHSELMCTVCDMYNHRKCSHVVLIADKVKDLHQKGEFKQLSATLDTLHGQLNLKKDNFKESLKSLEQSHNTIMEKINALRKAINDSLDQMGRKTIKELDTLLSKLRTSIQTDNGNCNVSIKKITSVKEDWLNIKGKSEAIQMITYRKCLDLSVKTKAVLQEMTVKNDITLSFTPDPSIQQILSTISGLGQILIKENTVSRQTKPEACRILSSKKDPENQTSETFKPSLFSSPKSGTPKEADIESKTSAFQKPDMISDQILVTPKQGDITHQTNAVNKQGHASDPIPISSTQSNNTSVQNKPRQVSDTVTSSLNQLVHCFESGAISKSDPNLVIQVKRSKKYHVKIKKDFKSCYITGICETATGELLITDCTNKKVKLLDQTYKVVAHCDLPNKPWSMCSIDSSLVAIPIGSCEVQFIKVTNRKLDKYKPCHFKHYCQCIAHNQGNLYIASDTALFHYTLNGSLVGNMTLVSKMYEDSSERFTIVSCAVSPDGDRIYVINTGEQLVTLSRDGTVISTLTDHDFDWRWRFDDCGYQLKPGIIVADTGQVLVCGSYSKKILQVDRDGKKRLAQVVTEKNGMRAPLSVYYSSHTGILIVGMVDNNEIVVFNTN